MCRQEEEVSGEHVHHWMAGVDLWACLRCQSAVPSEQEVHVILQRDKLVVRENNPVDT